MAFYGGRADFTKSSRVLTSVMVAKEEEEALTTIREEEPAPMKRLVVRDLPYHQSSNTLAVRHQMSDKHKKQSKTGLKYSHWLFHDWFHIILRFRTVVSIFFIVVIWTIFLSIFAALYWVVDRQDVEVNCGLGKEQDPIHFYGAFAFSLETTTTVGYGLPNGGNGFFDNCPELQVVIYFQMLLSMFFNAFLLSFIFVRISRSEKRAAQVIFSNKATLNREILPNGIKQYMLSARLYDIDSRFPVVEAHVRFYAVKHRSMHADKNRGTLYPIKMEPMRVSMPNDDLGAVLHMSVPTRATHHIDFYSPLNPPSKRKLGPEDGRMHNPDYILDPCKMDLREHDCYTGNQDGLRCVVCGETYGTLANLKQHILYTQHTEKHDDVPVEGSHQELDVAALFKENAPPRRIPGGTGRSGKEKCDVSKDTRIQIEEPTPPWYDEYRRYLEEANIEIICVMEGIDPIMSGTFQAVQSYTVDDIVFDREFAPCVMADRKRTWKEVGPVRRFFRRIFVGKDSLPVSIKIDLDSYHEVGEINEG
ncbi:hypothetical protein ACHAWF_005017 [Thalassiosira exigua]